MAFPQGPSHTNSGPARRAPAAGCRFSASHSCGSGFPGLFRISADTSSLPMSWRSAAHRSRSRSSRGSFSADARRSVSTRTRSEWPRVFRSWALRAATSSRMRTAARVGSSSSPASRASRTRSSRVVVDPTRRATANRDGARSGNSIVSWSSTASGSSRRANRSTAHAVRAEAANRPAHHRTTRPPSGLGTARDRRAATPTPAAMGTTRTMPRSARLRRGLAAHRFDRPSSMRPPRPFG